MWKKCVTLILTALLLMITAVNQSVISNWEKTDLQPSTVDGFTNDSEISSSKYGSNRDKYHQIFQMGLAGPGLTAWDYATGKGVNVAVIDGGANLYDKELKPNVKGVYNAMTGSEEWSQVHDSSAGHGTSCAKILGAAGNNKYSTAGVAYNVNLYIIKAGNGNEIYSNAILKGIRWAAKKNCRVISMSFGSDTVSSERQKLIHELYTKKENSILFVAAGGNTPKEEYHYPASIPDVLSVSALSYSSKSGNYTINSKCTYNDRMDIAAPGGSTSAAAPYAAGVAALIFQANPALTAKECAGIITSTAKDAGSKGYDKHYGYGIIQPLTAVQKAKYKRSSIPRKITGTAAYKKAYGSKTFKLNTQTTGSGVLAYKSRNSKVAAVNSSGYVTVKGTGKAVVKVSIPKSGIYGSASKNIAVTIAPKRPVVKVKNIKKKKLQVSWKRDSRVSGYMIYVASNSKFNKQKKYTVKRNLSKKTLSKLKKGKKYWIRIRTYKMADGKRIYSSYSKAKVIKIRR